MEIHTGCCPGDWAPVRREGPTRPVWDQESLTENPDMHSVNISQEELTAGQPLLTSPTLQTGIRYLRRF